MDVPYLKDPPKVIPIDIGRQLFVDDFLIAKMAGLKRTFHLATLSGRAAGFAWERIWGSRILCVGLGERSA